MKLAKLILHFNTPELTASLCKMVPGAIVIDNGSTTHPYNGLHRCIRQGNFGFTKGWNESIKALYEEFDAFWLMNSDIKIEQGSIDRVEKVLNIHPEILFFTPSYNCWMKHCQKVAGGGIIETGVMEFTAPIIRKTVFERIGFFDEIFVRGYGVEFDYCYRARMVGIKMYVDHWSTFYHMGQQTISAHEGLLEYSHKANFELTKGLIEKYGNRYKSLVFKGLTIKSDFDMKIAVYITIFGNYDNLKVIPAQEVNADYFVITDNPSLKLEGWKTVVPNFPRKDLHPRLRAKFYKLFPWECAELAQYKISIYIDASIRITSANFISTCIKNLNNDMLLFKHPQRNCIYQEGLASIGLKKYDNEPIKEQLDFYRKFYPANGGLYACGVLVRKHTDLIKKIMGDWWFEIIKYSYQDQLSLPVVLRANRFAPSTFAENQYKNSFLQVEWHDDRTGEKAIGGKGEGAKEQNAKGLLLRQQTNRNDRELITVLIPVWKTPIHLLKRAIESILNQTDTNFELLIVDDNNGERELLDVLHSYESLLFRRLTDRNDEGDHIESPLQPPVRVIRTTSNEGLARTLDFGISEAKGELIVRMDSDDYAHPELVARQRQFFAENQDAAICGVQLNLIQKDGKKRGITHHDPVVDREFALKNKGFWIVNHPGICYRKSVVTALGGYGDTPKHLAEDYALWCKFLQAGYKIYNIKDILIDYTVSDGRQLGQERGGKEWLSFLEGTRAGLRQ